MFFVFGGALLWWGALGDLMVWGVLAGGGSHVLDGCSSVLGPAVIPGPEGARLNLKCISDAAIHRSGPCPRLVSPGAGGAVLK